MYKNKNNFNKKCFILFLGIVASQAFAQYEIKKHTINSGGGKISGANYVMNSSIGQADASSNQTGGNYSLNGGFWHENNDLIFENGFE